MQTDYALGNNKKHKHVDNHNEYDADGCNENNVDDSDNEQGYDDDDEDDVADGGGGDDSGDDTSNDHGDGGDGDVDLFSLIEDLSDVRPADLVFTAFTLTGARVARSSGSMKQHATVHHQRRRRRCRRRRRRRDTASADNVPVVTTADARCLR